MRLDALERRALLQAISGIPAEGVYLFGSRVDDSRKGGDVDVLIFSGAPAFELSRQVAVRFFIECEERIDVVVMNPRALTKEQRAFLATVQLERIA
ncbi:MAG: nucleotidyltransferase domain-containing protein [Gammaproteobacteria bacterium]